jgi:hypothetical protein
MYGQRIQLVDGGSVDGLPRSSRQTAKSIRSPSRHI